MADVGFRLRVPNHRHRHRAEYARGYGAGVAVGTYGDGKLLAGARQSLAEARLNPGRAAIDHEALFFLVSPTLTVHEDKPAVVDPVGHFARRHESRLPDIVLFDVGHALG